MKKRKIFAAALVLLILLQLFAGCSNDVQSDESNEYDIGSENSNGNDAETLGAIFYSYANDWIDESFLEENRVNGAYYINENYVPHTEGESRYQYVKDKESPTSRTFIITAEEEYNRIFSNASLTVDFEKEIVILHVDCDTISITEGILSVSAELVSNKEGVDDATMPYPRCFVLRMKKTDVTKITFNKN